VTGGAEELCRRGHLRRVVQRRRAFLLLCGVLAAIIILRWPSCSRDRSEATCASGENAARAFQINGDIT
jgi:hypothetical protein